MGLLVFAFAGAAAHAADQLKVAGIEINGLHAITEAEFVGRIAIKKGDVFNEENIAKDVSRLAGLGIIVAVDKRIVPEGVIVVFNVISEKRLDEVVEVRFKGGSSSNLREITQTRKGSKLTSFLLKVDSDRIREFYVDKGYADCVVKPEVNTVSPGKVKVKFVVTKGPKFRLRKLTFVGNKAFKHNQLAKVMVTKVYAWLTARKFVRKYFDDDIMRLNFHYQANGYFDAVAKLQGLATDYEKGRVEAAIEIYEGPRYRIAEVRFDGNKAASRDDLLNVVKVKPGDFYTTDGLRADVDALNRYYTTGGRGYASVRITFRDEAGRDPATRVITYTIEEGKPTYIRRIDTRGNYKTRKKVIIREMRIEPGQLYDSDKVKASERRLKDLQYFENITTEMKKAAPPEFGAIEGVDYTDLVVGVEETTTGSLTAGAGYNTNSGVVGRIAVEQRNFDISNLPDFSRYGIGALNPSRMFVGGGQRLRLVAEPGIQYNYYYFEFMEPWFFDYPVEFTLRGYFYERALQNYTVERVGGTIGFARRWTREFKTSVHYRAEQVTIGGINAFSPVEASSQQGTHDFRSYRVGVDYDTRDSIILPTKGVQLGTYGELAGPPAGGNVGLWKTGINGGIYRKLFDFPSENPNVLHLSAETDFSGPAFNDPDVPIYERFFAGGIGSFRGFAFQGIGPRQVDPPTGNTALGGKFVFLGQSEYIIPLYKEDYQGYIFSDVGTLTDVASTKAFDQLRVSTGIGFRFNLPVMGRVPLNFYFAVPLKMQPRDRIQNFGFALGLFF